MPTPQVLYGSSATYKLEKHPTSFVHFLQYTWCFTYENKGKVLQSGIINMTTWNKLLVWSLQSLWRWYVSMTMHALCEQRGFLKVNEILLASHNSLGEDKVIQVTSKVNYEIW